MKKFINKLYSIYKILFSNEFAVFTYRNPVDFNSTDYMTAAYFYWNISDKSILSLVKSKLKDISQNLDNDENDKTYDN